VRAEPSAIGGRRNRLGEGGSEFSQDRKARREQRQRMDKIRILLVDDHTLFREGLTRLLQSEPDLEMAAHCGSVHEAIEILRKKPVDLVLLDFDLGNEDAFRFIERARQTGLEGRVLMVTAGMTDAECVQALGLGVGGIFLKRSSPSLLTEVIRRVSAGETWLDQSSVRALIDAAKQPGSPRQAGRFTDREGEVLQGVFEGLTNKEIGARIGVSESSVKAALQQLFQKTGVRTRSQLVRIALEDRSARG
jgi:DNA-binding NarL/FixJ family response regulator